MGEGGILVCHHEAHTRELVTLGPFFYVKVGRHWRHDGQLRILHLGIFEYSFR